MHKGILRKNDNAKKLHSDWQSTQVTSDSNEISATTNSVPISASAELNKFINQNAGKNCPSDPNELPELADIQDDKTMSVNTEEHINDDLNISPQENKEDINVFEIMKNVNIDMIKPRRGRPKGSK